MASKYEIASYLVSLHTLLDAQMRSGHAITSPILADEYERQWEELKSLINQEQTDE